jgi:hypothetical protein
VKGEVLEMKRKERSVSVERGRSGHGQQEREHGRGQGGWRDGSDDKNDVKEIVASTRGKIMSTLERALEMIEASRVQIEVQDAVGVWPRESSVMTDRNGKSKETQLKTCSKRNW